MTKHQVPRTEQHKQRLRESLLEAYARKQANQPVQLREDYSADPEWISLAAEHSIELPEYGSPCSSSEMRWFLEKLNVPEATYLSWSGMRNCEEFARLNPTWPLRAWAGSLLESLDLIRDEG